MIGMKKIFLAFLILSSFCSCSFGAVSDDIYVRKDIFEVYMKNINSNFEKVFAKLDKLEESMNDMKKSFAALETKVDGINLALSNRIDSVEKRFDDLRYDIYLIIGLLGVFGVFLGLPFFQKWLLDRKEAEPKQSLTIEDVEKVFERLLSEAKAKGAI